MAAISMKTDCISTRKEELDSVLATFSMFPFAKGYLRGVNGGAAGG